MARLAPDVKERGQFEWGLASRGSLVSRFLQATSALTKYRDRILLGCVSLETVLLLISVVPQTVWMSLHLPNGPIPTLFTPVAAAFFYALPTAIGALCHRWYSAVALATLPAWLALGVFAIVAAPRLGFAYLTQDTHAAGVIGTLELFAGMGLLGWILRLAVKDGLARLEGSR
jgi:hypothetical protein